MAPVAGSNRRTFEVDPLADPLDVNPPRINTLEPSRTTDERDVAVGSSFGMKLVVTWAGVGAEASVVAVFDVVGVVDVFAVFDVFPVLAVLAVAVVPELPPVRERSTAIRMTNTATMATVRARRI
jgi:hypothetical protein